MFEEITLPYGRSCVTLRVPRSKLIATLLPRSLPPVADAASLLRETLSRPVSSPTLREIAQGKRRVAIAIEDASRPVPNSLLIDVLLTELQAAGVTPRQVTLVVATGLHRPMTTGEMEAALGRWSGQVLCENHDAKDSRRLAKVGTTALGADVSVNRTFWDADLKITTGDVEYHQFCGYGGGVKCLFPGLGDEASIRANHSRMDLAGAGTGRLDGNPVREEIEEVGRAAAVDFNLSVVLDDQHRIVDAYAGDPHLSFRKACHCVDAMYRVEAPSRADLVIASPGGHPKDLDLYQSQKAIEEATQLVQPGGKVFVAACCPEGSGSPLFESWMDEAYGADDIIRRIRKQFVMGGHKAYQIAREVQRAKIYLHSQILPGRVRSWLMHPVASMEEVDRMIDDVQSIIALPQATLTHAVLPGD